MSEEHRSVAASSVRVQHSFCHVGASKIPTTNKEDICISSCVLYMTQLVELNKCIVHDNNKWHISISDWSQTLGGLFPKWCF